jgi:hypothetical protein
VPSFTFTRGDTFILTGTWQQVGDGPADLSGITVTSGLLDRMGNYHALTVEVAEDNVNFGATSGTADTRWWELGIAQWGLKLVTSDGTVIHPPVVTGSIVAGVPR